MTNKQSLRSVKAELKRWKKHYAHLFLENERLKSAGNALATQVLIQIYGGNRAEPLSKAYTNWRDEVMNQIVNNQKSKK